jgi:hypothetical protein
LDVEAAGHRSSLVAAAAAAAAGRSVVGNECPKKVSNKMLNLKKVTTTKSKRQRTGQAPPRERLFPKPDTPLEGGVARRKAGLEHE